MPGVFLQAFDQCIGCRACEAACPSGVPFSLLEHGQQRAAGMPLDGGGGVPRPAVPGSILRRMDRPGFLGFLSRSAAWPVLFCCCHLHSQSSPVAKDPNLLKCSSVYY